MPNSNGQAPAIIAKFSVSNATVEKLEEVYRRLDAAGTLAPAGMLYHVAFGARDNIQVIDIFDSPQSLDRFGKTLGPILTELGITAQPDVQNIYKIQGATDPRPFAP